MASHSVLDVLIGDAVPLSPKTTANSQDGAGVCSPTAPAARTVEDAISTRNILLNRFPLELVHIILDHAEYWGQVKAERKDEIAVCASAVFRANASVEYLATTPIVNRGPEDIRLKVARVEFTIVSHDQGWCDEPGLKGTYEGYTWFAAAIMRPDAANSSVAHEMPNPAGPRGSKNWEIQRNFCASGEWRRHIVAWNEIGETVKGTGAGTGKGFISSLAPGDRIAVIARALCPGRVNWVQSVEVSLYYRLA
ncbi:Ankyrin repeat-containing domain [Mycena sanguinolenta]|uniref:Ankyrin repeat-containing domain n=1 Tax=Mycena sanguinolenta TaxID=230812 RepID=A0A8H6Y2U5_9AGAR|nr:Ankyrin repeat-containing domain [Mycena sanguinolenta]